MATSKYRWLSAPLCCAALAAHAEPAAPAAPGDEMIVTTTREEARRAETPISISVVQPDLLDLVRPGHPSEILGRVPGVAVQQTNGEGHITGIRQPIGTSPVYLYLEDGVPVRASGFFNHNALYEVNLPQSGGVEVIRGPGTALQGSDAIGGVVNVLTRAPSDEGEVNATVEIGDYTWLRGLVSASDTWGAFGGRADLNVTHSDGWRDESGYDRQTLTLRGDRDMGDGATLRTFVSATNIDQDTGALSYLSKADYENDPTRNYTPFAYRKVQSARASMDMEREAGAGLFSVTPYLRWSEMELLPTFTLAFDPVISTTGYYSMGALVKYRQDLGPRGLRLITGVDLDYSPGSREEDRLIVTRDGPVYESYVNAGRIYDYDVTFWQASPYAQLEAEPLEGLHLTAGLRYDLLGFDYDNHLSDGAFTTQTPFGPRTYYRPADQDVDYDRLSPSVGVAWEFTPRLNGFLSYKQSFRVPQEGQLFRQGANLSSTDLEPVKADSYEIGLRGSPLGTLSWELSVYTMEKRDDILTYNDGAGPTLTNNGKTRHQGVEAAVGWQFHPEWRLDVAGSVSDHEYRDWATFANNAFIDFSGNTMASAPDNVGNATLAWRPARVDGLAIEAEWTYLGSYWMNDANTTRYDGHGLGNLRVNYATGGWEFFVRATNVFDARWATSAQVSNGQPQYAPGLPFSLYGGVGRRF